jgi:RNA ligase (TIGR02306 family)
VLASIQKIENIQPIADADRLESVGVKGWTCVVPKGQFNIGDYCVYIEIDTIVPGSFVDKEEPSILVRSLKLRGTLSQGLVLPIGKFPQCKDLPIGTDVSELLGVTHFEKNTEGKEPNYKDVFPRFMPKTDEPMIQSIPEKIQELTGQPYYISIKYNGCSSTFYNFNEKFGVCSRKSELYETDSCPFWNVAKKHDLSKILPCNIAIQGETCGPNISKNRMGLTDYELRVFNVFDIKKGIKFHYDAMISYLQGLNIPMVSVIDVGNSFNYTLEQLKQLAISTRYRDQKVEGLVIRSQDQKISFKMLNSEYLLKYKE